MSSINAADRSRYTDELRNQREEYQNREAENTKKQKKEVRRLNQSHDKELEKVKAAYEEKIEDLRKNSREQLTEKDQSNIAKVESLRKLYSDSMTKKQTESEDLRQSQNQAYQAQIAKERDISENQKILMKQQFDESLKDNNRDFEQFSTQARDEMQKSLSKSREKLSERHRLEMGEMVKDRDQTKLADEKKYREMRNYLEGQVKDQASRSRMEKARAEESWTGHYNNKQVEMGEIDKRRSEELKFEKGRIQEKFKDVYEKRAEELGDAFESFKENVDDRVENQLRAIKQENQNLKSGEVARVNTLRRLTDLEKDSLVHDYELRMKDQADVSRGQMEALREINRTKIQEAVDKNSEVLNGATLRFKSNQIIENNRHVEDRERLVSEKNSAIDGISKRSQSRIDKILKGSVNEQKIQNKLHNEGINSLKESYQAELGKQRETQLEQLRDTYARMEVRLKETELKNQTKLENTVNNYEERLGQMKDQYEAEIKKQAQAYESRIGNMKKEYEVGVKTEEVKSQTKLQDIQNVHEKEMDRVERRHQEQMAALTQKMNYYAKKS